jgi:acetyltransferase-like isoleucine patch superfamily enzyme
MLRRLYHSICYRIYSVGKVVAEQKRVERLLNSADVGERTTLFSTGSILNLSGVKDSMTIGSNCKIYGQLTTLKGGTFIMGDNCTVGDLARVVAKSNIRIGNRVMIAHNVNILDNNSHPTDAVLRHQDFLSNYNGNTKEFDVKASPVIIEDDVWIGFNSIILKGVRIGRGAIIGAGSVVAKDVEPWTINVGNPLRVVHKFKQYEN